MQILEALRTEQDAVDKEIIEVISKRLAIRKRISTFRIQNDLPTVDPARMKVVLNQAEIWAKEKDVPAEMARDVFDLLIEWSHRLDRDWRENAWDQKEELK